MTSFRDYVQELVDADPSFGERLALADAELELALRTAAVREARGMTQARLAKATGMRQPAIARYEKAGRTPTVSTLWRFATALNIEFRIGPHFAVDVVALPQGKAGQFLVHDLAANGSFQASFHTDESWFSFVGGQFPAYPINPVAATPYTYRGYADRVGSAKAAPVDADAAPVAA